MTTKKAATSPEDAPHQEQDPVNPQERYDPETEEVKPVQSDDQPEKGQPQEQSATEKQQTDAHQQDEELIREVEPAPPEEEQVQRQMVPPTVTDKGKKYPSDPNWYPDPDKPLPRSF